MKIIVKIFMTSLVLGMLFLTGCGNKKTTNNSQDKQVEAANFDLYPLKKGDKWGFIDSSGKWVIDAKYNGVSKLLKPIGLDTAVEMANNELLYHKIVTLKMIKIKNGLPSYEKVSETVFSGFSKSGLAAVKKDDKWGYINRKGEWVIKPNFDDACGFKDKMAPVANDGKTGYIDTKGNWLIKPTFEILGGFGEGICMEESYFKNGFVSAMVDGHLGVINKKGNWIKPPNGFYAFGDFNKNGITWVEKDVNNRSKYGLINKDKKILAKPIFDNIEINDNAIIAFLNKKAGIIDSNGNWVVKPKYDNLLFDKKSKYLIVKFHNKWGCIDTKGNIILKPIYSKIENCPVNNYAIVAENDKFGVVDKDGEWIIKPQFAYIIYGSVTDHLFFVWKNDKFGLIDKGGNWIKKPTYKRVDGFYSNGLAIVKTNNKYGVIDKEGNWRIKPIFDEVQFYNKLIMVKFGDKMGYINLDGKYLTFNDKDIKNNFEIND